MMPMVSPPHMFKDDDRLDQTRELLYVLLSDIHEGTVSSSELRGKLVNQLIHWHKLATNSEMSELFTDMRLLKELKFHAKYRTQTSKPETDQTIPELSKKIKDTIKAYISLLTKKIGD